MAQILCQVRIPHKSLIAADDVVNTFAFTGIADAEAMSTAALGMLKVFYNDLSAPQTTAVKNYLSFELNCGGARIKVYDWADPEPRVPILDESLGMTAATSTTDGALPGEVALGVSYLAAQESGVPAARRRGRIFLGPLRSSLLSGAADVASRPNAAARLQISLAAAQLASGTASCRWAVYSRRDQAFRQILNGYIDNAFDTQRRRGVAVTSRQAFTGGPT